MNQLLPLKSTSVSKAESKFISLLWSKTNLKQRSVFFILFFLVLCSGQISAQTVTLNITQNYILPETPVITRNGDQLNSSVSTGNQWYFNGTKIEGATQSSVVITQSGTYSVTVSNEAGCSAASTNYAAIKTEVGLIPDFGFTFKVFPNPNDGYFTVELTSSRSGQVELNLYATDGRSVASKIVQTDGGTQQVKFSETSLVPGTYTLQIRFGARVESKKLIIKD